MMLPGMIDHLRISSFIRISQLTSKSVQSEKIPICLYRFKVIFKTLSLFFFLHFNEYLSCNGFPKWKIFPSKTDLSPYKINSCEKIESSPGLYFCYSNATPDRNIWGVDSGNAFPAFIYFIRNMFFDGCGFPLN